MAQIIGLGGLFMKSRDPDTMREWYSRVLGIAFEDWGGVVFAPGPAMAHPGAGTVFSPFDAGTDYFEPSTADFMFNLMVDDLDGVLARCAENGVHPLKTFPDDYNGRFAHIVDPEGRKIELWQPRPVD